MSDDVWLPIIAGILLASAFGVGMIGGLMTPVGGVWRDGDRLIYLKQLGPLLRGRAERDGGFETYAGWALFGRVWIVRRDFGRQLLMAIGFPEETVEQIRGRISARLRFRITADELVGDFRGTRFTLKGVPQQVVAERPEKPVSRAWQRATPER
ncbi:MAG: hypothetical protein V3T05_14320 [Myxococcota bacterium]